MMRSFRVLRSALWLLTEFCEGTEGANAVLEVVKQCLGDLPLVADESITKKKETFSTEVVTTTKRQLVTSDGTYATQSAFSVPQYVDLYITCILPRYEIQ